MESTQPNSVVTNTAVVQPTTSVPQPPQPTVPDQAGIPSIPPSTNKPSLRLLIGIGIVALFILGVVVWWLQSMRLIQSVAEHTPVKETEVQTASSEVSDSSVCETLWVKAKLPASGETQPLFFHESETGTKPGYEAIMRRKVDAEGLVVIDVVTNALPTENSPYYLHALSVDKVGNICDRAVVGQFELIPGAGVWGSGEFSLPAKEVNDAEVFVVTEKGFGAKPSDKLVTLDDPSIILVGSFVETQ